MGKYIDSEKLKSFVESIGLTPQKSADYNDGRDDVKMMVLDFITSLQQEQQNPAEWSEEDRDMLNSIIATCKLAAQVRDSGPARHLLEMQERFLKSLLSRPKPSDNKNNRN